MKPRLLDLFCGAGLAGVGYARAGFEVWGVDLNPQPNYPYPFIAADALALDLRFLRAFDAIHASPPCQFGTALRHAPNGKAHPNLIPATRRLLVASGLPYVIENVDGPGVLPHLVNPVRLCGSMFGLGVNLRGIRYQLRRHRLFEANFRLAQPACSHASPVIGIYGGHVRNRAAKAGGRGTADFVGWDRPTLARVAMGVTTPATMDEISQAIPPAFTEYVGKQLLAHLNSRSLAA